MNSAQFATVEFTGEGAVATVPVEWLDADTADPTRAQCWWPAFNHVEKARKRCKVDRSQWNSYSVRVFKYAENFCDAEKMTEKSMFYSDLEEDRGKRRVSRPSRFISDNSDSDSPVEECRSKKTFLRARSPVLPPAPAYTSNTALDVSEKRPPANAVLGAVSQTLPSTLVHTSTVDVVPNVPVNLPATSQCSSHNNDQGFKIRVLSELSNIKKMMSELVGTSIQKNFQNNPDEDDVLAQRPMHDLTDVESLENRLNDQAFARKIVSLLSAVGGQKLTDCLRSMMLLLGTKELWSKYSLKGKKGKLAFQNLKICDVIIRACRNTNKNWTMSDITRSIGDVLKYFPKRSKEVVQTEQGPADQTTPQGMSH